MAKPNDLRKYIPNGTSTDVDLHLRLSIYLSIIRDNDIGIDDARTILGISTKKKRVLKNFNRWTQFND